MVFLGGDSGLEYLYLIHVNPHCLSISFPQVRHATLKKKNSNWYKLVLINEGPFLLSFDYKDILRPQYIVVKADGVHFGLHFLGVWCGMRMNLKA